MRSVVRIRRIQSGIDYGSRHRFTQTSKLESKSIVLDIEMEFSRLDGKVEEIPR